MPLYRTLRDLDWPLVIVSLAICALGVLQIYSATLTTKWEDAWWKQIVWVASGVVMMWVVSVIDYHFLLGRVFYLYAAAVALLDYHGIRGKQGIRIHALDQSWRLHASDFRIRENCSGSSGGPLSYRNQIQ